MEMMEYEYYDPEDPKNQSPPGESNDSLKGFYKIDWPEEQAINWPEGDDEN